MPFRIALTSPVLTLALSGCGHLFNQHAQMMDTMRGVMADTAARLGEASTGQIAAGGHVINPGIRVSGGVEYYAIARYEGLSGQVSASMSGRLNRTMPDAVKQQADRIWKNEELTTEEKLQRLARLLDQWTEPQRERSQDEFPHTEAMLQDTSAGLTPSSIETEPRDEN